MKKIVTLLMIVILMFTLVACGKDEQNPTSDQNQPSVSTENNENKNETDVIEKLTVEALKNAKETPASSFEYVENDDGTIEITEFIGDEKIVVIPEKINNKPVTVIGDSAFSNEAEIKGVKIADTVETIGHSAFINGKGIEIVILGDSVKIVESLAFSNCVKLEIVVLNDGLEELKQLCFGLAVIKEIEIPSSVKIMEIPFTKPLDGEIVVIGDAGSVAEQFVNEYGEEYKLVFQAK